jgi:hypothetical protein
MKEEDSPSQSLENLTKLTNVIANAENAVLLTEYSQYAGGARVFTFRILSRKPNNVFFIMKTEFVNKPKFSALLYWLFLEFTSPQEAK